MNALKVIIYFSIFKYPLTKEEIFSFSDAGKIEDIENQLKDLVEKGIVFRFDNFYSDINDFDLVLRRLKGNRMAKDIMPKAIKKAKFIASFPYIESVSISGALSKGYYDDDGDIDFFIITSAKHLWLARTLLVIYKKLFLLNSKKYFCVNYFIGSNHLRIPEKNAFTATELLTLIPIFGDQVFNKFLGENIWAQKFYPNKSVSKNYLLETFKKPLLSRYIEFLTRNKLGLKLDILLRKITLKTWKSKFSHLNKNEFELAMKSTNDVSKHHPQDFQNKVISKLNEGYDIKNKAFDLNLTLENA